MLKDIIEAGSELANPAMHDQPSRQISDAALKSRIEKVDELIDNAYHSAARDEQARV